MIQLKSDVRLDDLRPQILLALLIAYEVYQDYGFALTVTSGSDGAHSSTSLHYSGQAVDLRTRHIPSAGMVETVASTIRSRLTQDFDVVVEQDHIHLEYQPRR